MPLVWGGRTLLDIWRELIWQLLCGHYITLATVLIIVRCCSVSVKYPDVPHLLTSCPRRPDSAPVNNYIIALLRRDLSPLTKLNEQNYWELLHQNCQSWIFIKYWHGHTKVHLIQKINNMDLHRHNHHDKQCHVIIQLIFDLPIWR